MSDFESWYTIEVKHAPSDKVAACLKDKYGKNLNIEGCKLYFHFYDIATEHAPRAITPVLEWLGLEYVATHDAWNYFLGGPD